MGRTDLAGKSIWHVVSAYLRRSLRTAHATGSGFTGTETARAEVIDYFAICAWATDGPRNTLVSANLAVCIAY